MFSADDESMMQMMQCRKKCSGESAIIRPIPAKELFWVGELHSRPTQLQPCKVMIAVVSPTPCSLII